MMKTNQSLLLKSHGVNMVERTILKICLCKIQVPEIQESGLFRTKNVKYDLERRK